MTAPTEKDAAGATIRIPISGMTWLGNTWDGEANRHLEGQTPGNRTQ